MENCPSFRLCIRAKSLADRSTEWANQSIFKNHKEANNRSKYHSLGRLTPAYDGLSGREKHRLFNQFRSILSIIGIRPHPSFRQTSINVLYRSARHYQSIASIFIESLFTLEVARKHWPVDRLHNNKWAISISLKLSIEFKVLCWSLDGRHEWMNGRRKQDKPMQLPIDLIDAWQELSARGATNVDILSRLQNYRSTTSRYQSILLLSH